MVSVTGPGLDSESTGVYGTTGKAGTAGSKGNEGAGGGDGGGGKGRGGGEVEEAKVGGEGGNGGGEVVFPSVPNTSGTSVAVGVGGTKGTAGGSSFTTGSSVTAGGASTGMGKGGGGNRHGSSSPYLASRYRRIIYVPKAGEDPQTLARALVWRAGGTSKSKHRSVGSIKEPFDHENVLNPRSFPGPG